MASMVSALVEPHRPRPRTAPAPSPWRNSTPQPANTLPPTWKNPPTSPFVAWNSPTLTPPNPCSPLHLRPNQQSHGRQRPRPPAQHPVLL